MFQPYSEQPGARASLLYLKSGALWLVHLGLFAALRWLGVQLPREPAPVVAAEKPSAAEPPPKRPDSARPRAASEVKPALPSDSKCPMPSTNDVFGNDEGPWSDVIPYSNSTMIPPALLSGEKIQYTPEAAAARVQGLMVAKCTITCRGEVRNCLIIKTLPYMEQAVLSALESWRYRPVQFQGRPVTVSYFFNIKLSLP